MPNELPNEHKEEQQKEKAAQPIDFSTFIFSLGSAALINLSITPNPVTEKTEYNLDHAKQNIDLLSVLKEKTAGNLTKDEESLMNNLLHSLRMKYMEELKKGKP